MLINKQNLQSMFDGFNTRFNEAFAGAKTFYEQVSMTVPSTGRTENYGWLGSFPGMREWLGSRIVNSLSLQSYAITNKPFESTISVARDDIEDDQYGIMAPMFSELGRKAKIHPDELIAALIKSGFASNCYDGQFFFDADHPVGDGVTMQKTSIANTDGGAGSPWFLLDTSRPIKPFIFQLRKPYNLVRKDDERDDNVFNNREFIYGVDSRCNAGYGLWQLAWGSKQTLDATHFSAARQGMNAFTDDQGKPLGIDPDTILVGTTLRDAANTLFNTQTLANGASNPNYQQVKVIVSPYI